MMMRTNLHDPKLWADDLSTKRANACDLRARLVMTPSPREVVAAMRDLGMSDHEIGRYFDLPAECIGNIVTHENA